MFDTVEKELKRDILNIYWKLINPSLKKEKKRQKNHLYGTDRTKLAESVREKRNLTAFALKDTQLNHIVRV